MKKFVAIAMAVVFVLAFAGAVMAVSDTIKLSTGGKAKVVTFTHKTHTGYAGNDCKKCHHTGANSNCKGCHDATGSKGGGKDTKTAFHKQCIDCHKAGQKGPTSCAGCHKG